jgi:DNA invertase Pin-like site-specific DNA recombinase
MRSFKVGYTRVSTAKQTTARQDDSFSNLSLDRVYTDQLSGKDRNRPQLEKMISVCESGDQIYVKSIDRLGRNYRDVNDIVNTLNDKGVSVHFLKEGINLTGKNDDLVSRVQFAMFGLMAEAEREWIRERSLEGIAIAKLDPSKYMGRKRKLQSIQEIEISERLGRGESATVLSREFGISRDSVYKIRNRVISNGK